MIHTDIIITNSYEEGKTEQEIYSFFPYAFPGEITSFPVNLIYVTITLDTIYCMTTWLTDHAIRKIDLHGEELTICFHLREC